MGSDYDITYKKGKDNLVVDALSHTFDDHVSLSPISMPIPNWLQSVHQGYVNESLLYEINQMLANNPYVVPHYSWDGASRRYMVVSCFSKANIISMFSYMKSMLLHWKGTHGF